MPGDGRFQKGHPAYYRGGAVPGHRPTNTKRTMHKDHPNWKLGAYQFGTPKGDEFRKLGAGRPKDKERRCLEEIQAGQEDEEVLLRRYPPRMVRRMKALLDASEDPAHKNFLGSQYLIREILGKHRGQRAEAPPPGAADTITVFHGRHDVPMPGAENEGKEGDPPDESRRAGGS